MKNSQNNSILNDVVEHLCRPESYAGVYHLVSMGCSNDHARP